MKKKPYAILRRRIKMGLAIIQLFANQENREDVLSFIDEKLGQAVLEVFAKKIKPSKKIT